MKEKKYIVEYKPNGNYLTKYYYRGIKKNTTEFISEAHRFSAFELKLANMTILKNKKKFKVYYVDGICQ